MNRYKFKRAQVLSSTFKGHATFHFVHVLKMKMFMVFGQTKKDKDTLSPRSHTILWILTTYFLPILILLGFNSRPMES